MKNELLFFTHLKLFWHSNGTAWKVWIVMKTLTDVNTLWWLTVSQEKGEDVVLAVVTCLGHER